MTDNEMQIDLVTARRAAKYWADFIRRKKKITFDANADSPELNMAEAMANEYAPEEFHSYKEGVSIEDQVNAFEDALTLVIRANYNPYYFCVQCDYDPDIYLSKAAELAGIELGMFDFPWKHSMIIQGDKIMVKGVELL